MIIGNALLLIGASGCVIAPSMTFLLVARFVQGIGAAASAVVAFAMISDVYPPKKAATLYGVMNSVFTTFMALGHVFGGFINQTIGLRGNYGSVAILCLISWLFLVFFLPETNPLQVKKGRRSFDIKKTLSVYKSLLSSTVFITTSSVPSLLYGAYMAFVACAAFLYMETFHLSMLAYTLHQGFILLGFLFGSFLSIRITKQIGTRKCVIYGTILCISSAVGMVGLTLIAPQSPILLTLAMHLYSIGEAIIYPIVFAASLEIFPDIKGTASAAVMGMRSFLCGGVVGLASYLYDKTPFSIAIVILMVTIIVSILNRYFLHSGLLECHEDV